MSQPWMSRAIRAFEEDNTVLAFEILDSGAVGVSLFMDDQEAELWWADVENTYDALAEDAKELEENPDW